MRRSSTCAAIGPRRCDGAQRKFKRITLRRADCRPQTCKWMSELRKMARSSGDRARNKVETQSCSNRERHFTLAPMVQHLKRAVPVALVEQTPYRDNTTPGFAPQLS